MENREDPLLSTVYQSYYQTLQATADQVCMGLYGSAVTTRVICIAGKLGDMQHNDRKPGSSADGHVTAGDEVT